MALSRATGMAQRVGFRQLCRHSRPSLKTWRPAGHFGTAVGSRFSSFAVTFVQGDEQISVQAASGQTILEVAHENDIDIEGACGGECACSTCHVVLSQEAFDTLPEPDDDEVDMLDLAANVTDTSRLGCQVKLLKDRDSGLKIQ